jgi:hypothetical protein
MTPKANCSKRYRKNVVNAAGERTEGAECFFGPAPMHTNTEGTMAWYCTVHQQWWYDHPVKIVHTYTYSNGHVKEQVIRDETVRGPRGSSGR